MRDTMAPWRDNGGNRLFSTHVFGTPFMLNEKGEPLPWIATAITPNDDLTVWTMKLREDAVFQDGTPITAADFKAYWEHGAKPENIVAWGGASLTIGDILGWKDLRDGWVTEAEGLRVVDDHTLEIEIEIHNAAWPLYMAAWHVGISKLDQVLADGNWGNAPIGAGPFSLIYDPDSGLTELTRVDLVGKHWNGPHDTPIIEKLLLPNIPDDRARLIMFENGELDVPGGARPGSPIQPAAVHLALRRSVVHQDEDQPGLAGGPAGPQGPGPRSGHGEDRQRRLGSHGDPCQGADIQPDAVPQPRRGPSAVRSRPRATVLVAIVVRQRPGHVAASHRAQPSRNGRNGSGSEGVLEGQPGRRVEHPEA